MEFYLVPDSEIITLWKSGMTGAEIAQHYRASRCCVSMRLKMIGINAKNPVRRKGAKMSWTEPSTIEKRLPQAIKANEMAMAGASTKEIANKLGVSHPTVSRLTSLYRSEAARRLMAVLITLTSGVNGWELTEHPGVARDRRIVELAHDGLIYREIAEECNTSVGVVSRVLKRNGISRNGIRRNLTMVVVA